MPEPHQRESDRSLDSSSPAGGLDRRLSKSRRLTRSDLFSETFAQNRKQVGRLMVLWVRSGEGASFRLGVVTSKKVSLRANKRNLARRRLREAYRNLRPYFTGELDVLLVARRSILGAPWETILSEMLYLARKAEIISPDNLVKARDEHGLT